MSKFSLYALVILLDMLVKGVVLSFPMLAMPNMIALNIFFFIVLLHANYHALSIKEGIVVFLLGVALDFFYATPLFVNAVSLMIVVGCSHYIKSYLNDSKFERVIFIFIVLFLREVSMYMILLVTGQTLYHPVTWFTQRTFFVLLFNIPWMILSVWLFEKYQHVETKTQKRRRQQEKLFNFR